MASLKDVARIAGVDISTASRVLSGDPRQGARPSTRERILAAAAELGYRPNASARSLRTQRSDVVGLVVPDLDNVAFQMITHGVQSEASALGYLVLLVDAHIIDGNAGQIYERLIREGRVDGLLVGSSQVDDTLPARLGERELPVILVNRRTETAKASVVVDDERGSQLAVEHLLSLGHERIGFVAGAAGTDTARRREAGFRLALREHGVPLNEGWIADGGYKETGGHAAMRTILDASERPTGLYAANLMSALGALAALREAGLRVPADISVLAMDSHLFANYTQPALTTVRMPLVEMGRKAAQMMGLAIAGQDVGHVMLDTAPSIEVRESTAPPRAWPSSPYVTDGPTQAKGTRCDRDCA